MPRGLAFAGRCFHRGADRLKAGHGILWAGRGGWATVSTGLSPLIQPMQRDCHRQASRLKSRAWPAMARWSWSGGAPCKPPRNRGRPRALSPWATWAVWAGHSLNLWVTAFTGRWRSQGSFGLPAGCAMQGVGPHGGNKARLVHITTSPPLPWEKGKGGCGPGPVKMPNLSSSPVRRLGTSVPMQQP